MENYILSDKFYGCLVGGAAGDALGFPIEFLDENEIFKEFGSGGITEYKFNKFTGTAIISDDTQMTMFTAQGILDAYEALEAHKYDPIIRHHIAKCYQEWFYTQGRQFNIKKNKQLSWLCGIPDLFDRRFPGNTCLSALSKRKKLPGTDDFIADKLNDSCGCGGVMRVAPLGFIPCDDITLIDMEAAQAAAITHSHSLGYIPAAILAHIIHRSIYRIGDLINLEDIVTDAVQTAEKLFDNDSNLPKQIDGLNTAIGLSQNGDTDLNNIHLLGEGWVGDEALNIAVYCALRHKNDFSAGIIAAVNHGGDSDSTGSICGNILGAYLGIDGIDDKWKLRLELRQVMDILASSFVER